MAPAKPRQISPFDPQALLDVQRRNFDAFTKAGEIVAAGMRTYAERQAAMVQEGMRGFLGEVQAGAVEPKGVATPAEQAERMRAAFEKMLAQVQELSQLLIKVQSEALGVFNASVMRNLESLGTAAPDLADLQDRAKAAFEAANRETTAVVGEMKRRMATLEAEVGDVATPPAAEPAPRKPAPPKPGPRKTAKAKAKAAAPRARRSPAKQPS